VNLPPWSYQDVKHAYLNFILNYANCYVLLLAAFGALWNCHQYLYTATEGFEIVSNLFWILHCFRCIHGSGALSGIFCMNWKLHISLQSMETWILRTLRSFLMWVHCKRLQHVIHGLIKGKIWLWYDVWCPHNFQAHSTYLGTPATISSTKRDPISTVSLFKAMPFFRLKQSPFHQLLHVFFGLVLLLLAPPVLTDGVASIEQSLTV
jgi:hypothetical protein